MRITNKHSSNITLQQYTVRNLLKLPPKTHDQPRRTHAWMLAKVLNRKDTVQVALANFSLAKSDSLQISKQELIVHPLHDYVLH